MAKLYFRYGAMGSSKTANAIMVYHNYLERGQRALMLKPKLENREGERVVASRSGLHAPCSFVEELDDIDVSSYNCLIIDEAQFMTRAQVEKLTRIVDEMNIPVICYGLRADFRNELFEGSQWLLAWADTIEEIKTVCWCGKKALCNTRIYNGKVTKEGAQIMLGGSESYVALCRKHWRLGQLAPREIRHLTIGKEKYGYLLSLADPGWKDYLEDSNLYVLSVDGRVVSEITVSKIGEILNIATLEDERRKGYATSLIEYAKTICRADLDRLTVSSDDPFFTNRGFKKGILIIR